MNFIFNSNSDALAALRHAAVVLSHISDLIWLVITLPNNSLLSTAKKIEGSTDRCCIAIVTNERVLLSGSDQKTRTPSHFVCQAGKQTFKDRHICTMVYGALLMSATDTN